MNSDLESATEIGSWCRPNSVKPINQINDLKYEKIIIPSNGISKTHQKFNITLVTQVSMDRLLILERQDSIEIKYI